MTYKMDLRRKAIETGSWRVLIGLDKDGRRVFRDNKKGDPLPEEGENFGLPPA